MGDEECRIQINNGGDWIEKAESERQQLSDNRLLEKKQWEGESIYRIPWSVRKLRSAAYQPQRVSIGPYHHGENSLKPMEKHKRRAFLNFLDRKKERLQYYVNALEPKVEELMGAYDQLQPHWKENRKGFLELMIVDACFILELMDTAKVTATKSDETLKEMGYDAIDPVFSRHGHLYVGPCLRRDMLMLENQIPLQLLSNILLVADGGDLESKQKELIKKILEFLHGSYKIKDAAGDVRKFKNCFRGRRKSNVGDDLPKFEECLHILGVYRKSRLLVRPPRPVKNGSISRLLDRFKKEEEELYIRSATELVEAGIRFKKSETTKLNDVSYEYCGVLKLPVIEVDDVVETEFLNMMALERLHGAAGSEVTSYVILMDKMIDSAKDVSLLHWDRILRNHLGSDDAVATLFNSLSREACLDQRSDLVRVQEEVTKYYRSGPGRWMAYAKHTYFNNPWVSLTVVAAIFLFALTIVQTVYAVLDYHRPDKSPPPHGKL